MPSVTPQLPNRQPWTVRTRTRGLYEVWGEAPLHERSRIEALRLAEYPSRRQAEHVAHVLNDLWSHLAVCLSLAEACRLDEESGALMERYLHIDAELLDAGRSAALQAATILDANPVIIRRVFEILFRTVRDCSGYVVRYRRERDNRRKAAGALRIRGVIRETDRKIRALYTN
ncbi:MAG: hypothetical protein AAF752_03695 [Bacteroidota bacterium]